jgi:hypothetical protein
MSEIKAKEVKVGDYIDYVKKDGKRVDHAQIKIISPTGDIYVGGLGRTWPLNLDKVIHIYISTPPVKKEKGTKKAATAKLNEDMNALKTNVALLTEMLAKAIPHPLVEAATPIMAPVPAPATLPQLVHMK